MELKPCHSGCNDDGFSGLNRTIVELKHRNTCRADCFIESLNRTIVELKLLTISASVVAKLCLNRTIVELKQCQRQITYTARKVLESNHRGIETL